MNPTVFISFNEKSELGRQTALRLQTIASLYGFKVYLPGRSPISGDEPTLAKIYHSDYYVVFALEKVSKQLLYEINYALEQNKTVIVLYDKEVGSTLKFEREYKNMFISKIDFENNYLDKQLEEISEFLGNHHNDKKKKREKENALLALLGIGLGAVFLGYMLDKDNR